MVLTGNPGSPGTPSGPCNTEGQTAAQLQHFQASRNLHPHCLWHLPEAQACPHPVGLVIHSLRRGTLQPPSQLAAS